MSNLPPFSFVKPCKAVFGPARVDKSLCLRTRYWGTAREHIGTMSFLMLTVVLNISG